MPQDILKSAIHSPFPRLRALLDGLEPKLSAGQLPIDMTIGEPRHQMPDLVVPEIARTAAGFAKYPPIQGTPELRAAIAGWLERRYQLDGRVDPERHLVALNGSREGLFSAIFPAIDRRPKIDRPAVLLPNPFYQAYLAAALAAGTEPVMLAALPAAGFLPDLDALGRNQGLLARTVAMFLCSPANPQGAVADLDYWRRAIELSRRHDFMLFADECYSEIYGDRPPAGALEAALSETGVAANVVIFNSLSKRSNLPGLRSGFAAGDPDFIARLVQFRNVAGPQMPLPVQAASTAIWADEAHVVASRSVYQAKFAMVEQILGNRTGVLPPDGGFFLWVEVTRFGGSENAAVTIWKRAGVRVLPGAYLSFVGAGDADPGRDYIRIALVHDLETTRDALERLVEILA